MAGIIALVLVLVFIVIPRIHFLFTLRKMYKLSLNRSLAARYKGIGTVNLTCANRWIWLASAFRLFRLRAFQAYAHDLANRRIQISEQYLLAAKAQADREYASIDQDGFDWNSVKFITLNDQ